MNSTMTINSLIQNGSISMISGGAFKSSFFNESKTGIPIIRIRDIMNDISKTFYSGDFDSSYLIKNNDILIAMDGNFKISIWNGGKALLNQRVCRIRLESGEVDLNYLYFYLPKYLKQIEDKTSFSTVKHLSLAKIKSIPWMNKSIDEQKEISFKLGLTKSIIKKQKHIISLLDDFLKSTFLEMFGDPIKNEKT